jgi:hypothetical protein
MVLVGQSVESIKKLQHENRILKADFTPAELEYYSKASTYDDEEEDTEGDGDPKGKGKPAKKKAFRLASHTERAAIMKAAAPALPPEIQKILDDNAAMAKRISDLEAGGSLVSLAKRATELGMPEAEAVTLQKAYQGDKASVDKLLEFIKSAVEQARLGGVFKEFGSSHGDGNGGDKAIDQLNALAKALAEKDSSLTMAKAFEKVYSDPKNADLVKRERAENRPVAA